MSDRAGGGVDSPSSTASPDEEDKEAEEDLCRGGQDGNNQQGQDTGAVNPPPAYPCGVCQEEVDDQGMGCEGGCDKWYHISCINMSPADYESFSSNPRAYWECSSCHPLVKLPEYSKYSDNTERMVFGELRGQELYESVNRAYDEVTKWTRNIFMPPTGHAGQEFVAEVTKCIHNYNKGTPLEPVALKMALLCFPLLLQKPSKKSKTRDHVKSLDECLLLWKAGNIDDLVHRGKTIQNKFLALRIRECR